MKPDGAAYARATELKLATLRGRGWTVAVHNDYRLAGIAHTFWLMTKGDVAAKGEGESDLEALTKVEIEVDRIEKGNILIPVKVGTRRIDASRIEPP